MATTEVPTALTEEETMRFRTQGYLGPYQMCSPEEMADLRPAIVDVVQDETIKQRNWREHNRHLDSRVVYDLATHPEILSKMVSLYGPDLLLWRTNFFVKYPGDKAVPWHQDANYWPLEPPIIITAWIAVDPSTKENGNIQIIPGSHRKTIPHVKATPEVQFKQMADDGYYDPNDLIDLEMQPGEFILFNERTLHHSKANLSDKRRIGLAVRAIIPQVGVLKYDRHGHALHLIHGKDTMGFNKIIDPPP
jgi:ectoine hydroxylase-related dioxygenase (phytanoyl-CoA dioxygenase family)